MENMTKHEQLDLIRNIEFELSALGDYLYSERDVHVNNTITRLETALNLLKNSFYDKNTYIALVDRETGEIVMKHFEKGDVISLCHSAAQYYAWCDCDDTYRLSEIVCDGHEIGYVGWRPGMLFEFKDYVTGEIVYSAYHEEWEH